MPKIGSIWLTQVLNFSPVPWLKAYWVWGCTGTISTTLYRHQSVIKVLEYRKKFFSPRFTPKPYLQVAWIQLGSQSQTMVDAFKYFL